MSEDFRYVTCVCTANICRSPMAEKLLLHALAREEEPLRSLKVISTGISAVDGNAASPNAVSALKKVGLNLDHHRSKRITREIVLHSVLILCMTETHRYILKELFPELKVPLILFRENLPPPADPQIPDPFGMNLQAYEDCRDQIVEAIPGVVAFLKKILNPGNQPDTV